MVRRDDSSPSVTEMRVECNHVAGRAELAAWSDVVAQVPTSSDGALRLAIKLALDERDYERAAALLDVLRLTTGGRAR